eukprot:scaffold169625_cov61-Cyclotella_meneghiniana.AAC.1
MDQAESIAGPCRGIPVSIEATTSATDDKRYPFSYSKTLQFISGMWEVGADNFRQKYNRKGYPQTTSGIPGGCGELGRQRCLGTL